MSEELIRGLIAVLLIACFFTIMMVTLMGVVKIGNPETAKLVGGLFGYFTGVLSSVLAFYFRRNGSA